MQLLKLLLFNIVTLSVSSSNVSYANDGNDDDWGRFDDELDDEEIYGISPEEYRQFVIPEQYIIGLNSETVSNASNFIGGILQKGGFVNATALWHYKTTTLTGATVAGVDDHLYTVLQNDPNVIFIEPDVLVTLDTITNANWQSNPPNWGLDRIDQLLLFNREKPLDQMYKFDQTGHGILVFVLDTGIRWGHEEFMNDPNTRSRVICGFDAFNWYDKPGDWNNGCYDGVGHGTHVAAIIGGSYYGVAKDAALVSVKVFTADGRGSIGSVLAGLDYVIKSKEAVPDDTMVANLSLGTPVKLNIFQMVVARLVELGIPVVASAGNDAGDACTKYPGGMNEVFTIAATNVNDEVPGYSNLGPCVDMFAPGDRITSAWRNSNIDRATLSGTSQAAAFATGAIALVLEQNPEMSPMQVKLFLQDSAAVDVLRKIPADRPTLNLMLNMAELSLTKQ